MLVLTLFWIVFLVLSFAMCVWGTISPRSQWHTLSGWLYRAGSEPSDFHFGLLRLRNIFGAVLSVVLIIVFVVLLFQTKS